MEELSFKIVKVQDAHDEVIALVGNFVIGKAAFDKALFVYPKIIWRCARARESF
jgi:hypothetical protein